MGQVNTATIKIEDNSSHRGVVRGAVNGQRFEFPVGKEVEVTEGQLNSLRDSRVEFTIVSPLAGDEGADEGSSAPSTETNTAIRAEPPAQANASATQGDSELSQRTDEELTKDSQKVSQEQAETGTGSGGAGTEAAASPTPTPASVKATTTKPKPAKGGTKPKTTAAKK